MALKSKTGWLIIHPDGWIEIDYFHTKTWLMKDNKRTSRFVWMRTFRPNCQSVRGHLYWEVPRKRIKK